MTTGDVDVLVLGGGLTGLAFGSLLRQMTAASRPGLSIAVLDNGPAPAAPPASPGLRVVALNHGARVVLERCGAWAGLPAARIGPYRRMVVWQGDGEPGGAASITFDAADQGVAELGYIVESELLRARLWEAATTHIELSAGQTPSAATIGRDAVQVALGGGATLSARLVVGADGHASWLRRTLAVGAVEHAYGQDALVAHVASERPHDDTAWQCFGVDGPLALLPLPDGRSSIVWSCESTRCRELARTTDERFNRELSGACAGVLGALRVTTARQTFPLAAARAVRATGMRFALIGDAAHRVHPLAGQGVNLGFQDAAVLAEVLADHLVDASADPGDPAALRRFERRRAGANHAALAGMTVLNRLFSGGPRAVARAAGLGLGLVDALSPVKRRLADYAMGRSGDLPAWVRTGRVD